MGIYDISIGPMYIGTLLNVMLLGTTFVQLYMYILTGWEKDKTWLKSVVVLLVVSDVVSSGLAATFVYQYTIRDFGNNAAIQVANPIFTSQPFMTGLTSSITQSFFAWRVRRLTGRRWLSYIIVVSAITQLLMATGTTIGVSIVKVFTQFQKFQTIVIVWLVLSVLTDVTITTTLVRYLRKQKTGYKSTDTIVERLIVLTVQTGAITAVWATIDLIIYLVFPNSLHLIFNIPLGKLYSNSLLSTLNARARWAAYPSDLTSSAERPHVVLSLNRIQSRPANYNHANSVKVFHPSDGDQPTDGVVVTTSTSVQRDSDTPPLSESSEIKQPIEIVPHSHPFATTYGLHSAEDAA